MSNNTTKNILNTLLFYFEIYGQFKYSKKKQHYEYNLDLLLVQLNFTIRNPNKGNCIVRSLFHIYILEMSLKAYEERVLRFKFFEHEYKYLMKIEPFLLASWQ